MQRPARALKQACRTLLVPALIWCGLTGPAQADEILVFAAQSMADALAAAGERSGEETGHEMVLSLGASSTMARQIENGAPANLFVSANRQWMDYLEQRGAILPETRRDIAGNSLVLVAPADAAHPMDIADLPEALGDGRLAVGDPAHVPAGIYAEAALREVGLWDAVSGHLAPAANVRDALRFVEEGAAPFGIVYATDAAASDRVTVVATFPAESHEPIAYPAAATSDGDTPAARELLDWLAGPQAAEILGRFGFSPPPGEK